MRSVLQSALSMARPPQKAVAQAPAPPAPTVNRHDKRDPESGQYCE